MNEWEVATGELERSTSRLVGACQMSVDVADRMAERQAAIDRIAALSSQSGTREITTRLADAFAEGERALALLKQSLGAQRRIDVRY